MWGRYGYFMELHNHVLVCTIINWRLKVLKRLSQVSNIIKQHSSDECALLCKYSLEIKITPCENCVTNVLVCKAFVKSLQRVCKACGRVCKGFGRSFRALMFERSSSSVWKEFAKGLQSIWEPLHGVCKEFEIICLIKVLSCNFLVSINNTFLVVWINEGWSWMCGMVQIINYCVYYFCQHYWCPEAIHWFSQRQTRPSEKWSEQSQWRRKEKENLY